MRAASLVAAKGLTILLQHHWHRLWQYLYADNSVFVDGNGDVRSNLCPRKHTLFWRACVCMLITFTMFFLFFQLLPLSITLLLFCGWKHSLTRQVHIHMMLYEVVGYMSNYEQPMTLISTINDKLKSIITVNKCINICSQLNSLSRERLGAARYQLWKHLSIKTLHTKDGLGWSVYVIKIFKVEYDLGPSVKLLG